MKEFINHKQSVHKTKTGLCYRCEERARVYEGGHGHRAECNDKCMSVHGCYMYKPVMPCITARQKGDRRPRIAGWGISAREEFHHVATDKELQLNVSKHTRGCIMIYWLPYKRKSKGKC